MGRQETKTKEKSKEKTKVTKEGENQDRVVEGKEETVIPKVSNGKIKDRASSSRDIRAAITKRASKIKARISKMFPSRLPRKTISELNIHYDKNKTHH